MNNILQRITEISEIEGVSISKIEQKIGASKGVLYKAIQKNTDIQSKWIVLIVENFPMYNAEWLLTGRGEKIKSNIEKDNLLNEPTENYGLDYKELYIDAKYTIEVQKKYIESLELQLQNKRKAG